MLETTVQFREVFNGLPVVSPDAGDVRVTLEDDGTPIGYERIAPIVA